MVRVDLDQIWPIILNFDELLILIDAEVYAKTERHLRDIDVLVLRESLNGQGYDQIAIANNYTGPYLRQDVGPKLWKTLSRVIGEKVNKKNCRSCLERYWQSQLSLVNEVEATSSFGKSRAPMRYAPPRTATRLGSAIAPSCKVDWGDALDSSVFYGRVEELGLLKSWILTDQARLIALLGMGGIGKTTLSVKLAEEIQDQFDYVFWRSLRNARTFSEILRVFLDWVGEAETLNRQLGFEEQLNVFMTFLKANRCLIVLDNLESIFAEGTKAGSYAQGFEDYGQFMRRIADTAHQSCLIITSREKPIGFAQREGVEAPTRSFGLSGLSLEDAAEILKDKGITSVDLDSLQIVLNHYGGNPLALKIVAAGILEFAEGDFNTILPFLNRGLLKFQDIDDLLGRQFSRLNEAELLVMYWLALSREPVTLQQLEQDIFQSSVLRQLPEAAQSLSRRSLIERSKQHLLLQPVVMEYVTQRFIDSLVEEVLQTQVALLQSYAILKAQARDDIREAQLRFIVKPLLSKLQENFESQSELIDHLREFFERLRQIAPRQPGYGAGNLMNLLRNLNDSLEGLDCSDVSIWQAYLVGLPLLHLNFQRADFSKSIFTSVLSTTLSVTFSPNGKHFALGNADNTVRVWTVRDYQEDLICYGHQNWVSAVTFFPDSQVLVSGSFDKTLKLWDLETGQCLKTLVGHEGWIWAVSCSPTTNLIASAGDDHTIRLWDRKSGDCIKILEGHTSTVWALSFSPDGKILASSSGDGSVKLWSINTGNCQDLYPPPYTNRIRSICFCPTGKFLAIGGLNCEAELWSMDPVERRLTLKGHRQPVITLAISDKASSQENSGNGDSNTQVSGSCMILATGSQDCTLKLWDLDSGVCLTTLKGHPNGIWSLGFHPTLPLLISGSNDSTVKLWNTQTGESIRTLQGYSTGIKAIALSPDDRYLASAGDNALINLRVMGAQVPETVLAGHSSWVWSLAFTTDGRGLISCGNDNTLKLWDVSSGQLIRTYFGHLSLVFSLSLSSDSKLIASGSEDQTVRIWDLDSGTCLSVLPHKGRVWSVAFSPHQRILACGNQETMISLWDVDAQTVIHTLKGHRSLVFAIAFNPQGSIIASGSDDGSVKLWDALTGECLKTLMGHQGSIWTVAFSPNGKWMASGGNDQIICIWEMETGQCQQVLKEHQSAIWTLAFRSNGQLVSGSQEGTIKFWSVEEGRCIHTIQERRPYEGMNISGATGLTEAQRLSLVSLGAVSRA